VAADAARRLEAVGFDPGDARLDATVLARSVLNWDQADWLTNNRAPATAAFSSAFDALVRRRIEREPVAYLTGEREFYGRTFHISRDVLIPRPETELLVDEALERIPAGESLVVDVGTGSGCVAITLALEAPEVRVVATDVSGRALDVARRNAERLGATGRVSFVESSLTAELSRTADLVVSNPPYVATTDRSTLPRDVRDYEPALALFGGADGLDVIRPLVEASGRALKPGGWVVFEIGAGQADQIERLLADHARWGDVTIAPDLAGIRRVVSARRTPAFV
jgi:release factor glutamine methyltransferase